jgi:hypothetical protein
MKLPFLVIKKAQTRLKLVKVKERLLEETYKTGNKRQYNKYKVRKITHLQSVNNSDNLTCSRTINKNISIIVTSPLALNLDFISSLLWV